MHLTIHPSNKLLSKSSLYEPPGTGKTTTIINLVDAFQRKHNQHNKGLVIHLNTSDERGIDIIRNQINQFVHSKALFTNGTKLIILDEVDYMTKTHNKHSRVFFAELTETFGFA